MTAKQYLSQIHRLRRRIRDLELEQERLRTQAEGLKAIVYKRDRVQTSVQNRFDSIMADLLEAEQEYATASKMCAKKIRIRADQIDQIENDKQAEILRLRYIEQKDGRQLTIAECAKAMAISYDWARHLHGNALNVFQKRYL